MVRSSNLTISIYNSGLGKFAFGCWRALESTAQKQEEASVTICMCVICACTCVCAGRHACVGSGPQDGSALLLLSWRL